MALWPGGPVALATEPVALATGPGDRPCGPGDRPCGPTPCQPVPVALRPASRPCGPTPCQPSLWPYALPAVPVALRPASRSLWPCQPVPVALPAGPCGPASRATGHGPEPRATLALPNSLKLTQDKLVRMQASY